MNTVQYARKTGKLTREQIIGDMRDLVVRYPYVYKDSGKVLMVEGVDNTDLTTSDFYALPKTKKTPSLTNAADAPPYGKMFTISLPILDENGNFLGVVAGDILVDSLQSDAVNIKPMGGYISIINNAGFCFSYCFSYKGTAIYFY